MQFRLFGFPVTLQQSMFVIAGIYLLFGLERQEPVAAVIGGVVAIFASILWHELGHAFVARWFTGPDVDITLHGFGGLTRHRPTDHAAKDLAVQLAGPLFGLSLGFLALPFAVLVSFGPVGDAIVYDIVFVNLFWSLFNLLPLSPLDGGHALTSVLRMLVPSLAYPITIGVGLVGGVAMALGALWLSSQGVGSALFLLLVAGMIVSSNWSLRRRWLDVRAGRVAPRPDAG